MRTWLVRDVMTTDVVSVDEWTPCREIINVLIGNRISGAPVVDYFGHVGGVVSETDLIPRVEAGGERRRPRPLDGRRRRAALAKAAGTVAGDVMTVPAITVTPGTPLPAAARTLRRAGVKRLPVVDDLGRLIGIVSRGDLLRVYLRADAAIRQDVVREVLQRCLTVEPGQVWVTVSGGIVRLAGRLDRRSAAELAVRLTRAIPGVMDVVDRLEYDFDDSVLKPPASHPFDAEPYEPRAPLH